MADYDNIRAEKIDAHTYKIEERRGESWHYVENVVALSPTHALFRFSEKRGVKPGYVRTPA